MRNLLALHSVGPVAFSDSWRKPGALPSVSRNQGLAVLIVRGMLSDGPSRIDEPSVSWSDLASELRMLASDPSVSRVLLRLDSPGGTVAGASDAIEAMRVLVASNRVVYIHTSSLLASAALWLAACDPRIRIHASKTAIVGSIGAFAVLIDSSLAFAAAGLQVIPIRSGWAKGNPIVGEPITGEIIETHQSTVDALAAEFIRDLAAGRRMPFERAEAIATGEAWIASRALQLGLIDAAMPLDETLANILAHPTRDPNLGLSQDQQLARQYANASPFAISAKWGELLGPIHARESGRQRAMREQDLAKKFPEFAKLAARAVQIVGRV